MKASFCLIIFFNFIFLDVGAEETCSRIAIINFQEVLIDTNSSLKGEGLRYYLEKDPKAQNLLNLYQKKTRTKWQNAFIGTTGTALLLAGAFTNNNKSTRKTLIITGVSIVFINFFVAKTLQKSNENLLLKAINEYNKRNFPRIYFAPERNIFDKTLSFNGIRFGLLKQWTF